MSDIKYATWYIYDGSDSDVTFVLALGDNSEGPPSGTNGDVTVFLTVINNTSNTITLTMGVAISQDDIVLPSYMKLVSNNLLESHTLNITKGTGVDKIYYKVNGSSSYVESTGNVSSKVGEGLIYYYYGVPSSGYAMTSCTESEPCSGTMRTSDIDVTITASDTFVLTLNKGTGVDTMYYKINGASDYTSSTDSWLTLNVKYGTTYYYYGVPSSGYIITACGDCIVTGCTLSNPCSGTMGGKAVTEYLTATNRCEITFNGSGYYKTASASSYTQVGNAWGTSGSSTISGLSCLQTIYYYKSSLPTSTCTKSKPCSVVLDAPSISVTIK